MRKTSRKRASKRRSSLRRNAGLYNPLAEGHLEIDHLTAKRTGLKDRTYFKLTAEGRKYVEVIEEFLATSGFRHTPDRSKVRKTKRGYVSVKA
jgi:hypothetical protein